MKWGKIVILTLVMCTWLFSSQFVYGKDTLLFAVDLFRHGDRTPNHVLPASPYHWYWGLGQLTPNGMQRAFQQGILLRKMYVDYYHLLPEHYQSDSMYVQATAMNRVLATAESLLLGLYPLDTGPLLKDSNEAALPHRFQPIPIYSSPKKHNVVLAPHVPSALFDQYVAPRSDWQERNHQLQSKFKAWGEASGLVITNLKQLNALADNLYIRMHSQVALPAGISDEEAKEIIQLAVWSKDLPLTIPEINAVIGTPFLVHVEKYLKQAVSNPSALKYVLLVAHDSTIATVLRTLDIPFEQKIPFAAHINFLLFEKDNKEYVVKIAYNNRPVTIPACNNLSQCTLEQWSALIQKKQSLAKQVLEQTGALSGTLYEESASATF